MQNAPMLRPELRREIASAMCRPMPLLPHHDRADVRGGRELDQVVDRIPREDFDALALHDLRYGFADFHLTAPSRPGPKPRRDPGALQRPATRRINITLPSSAGHGLVRR